MTTTNQTHSPATEKGQKPPSHTNANANTNTGNTNATNKPNNTNHAQMLFDLFKNNRATKDVLTNYHEGLAHLPAGAIVSKQLVITKGGFNNGENSPTKCIDHLLIPLLDSDLNICNTALIPPIDDKGNQAPTVYEPILHPKGAFIIGSPLTKDNKAYLVTDIQTGLNLYRLDPTATIMICFTPANLAYVAKQWQFKAQGRLCVPIGIHEIDDYKALLTNTNAILYVMEFSIDWEIDPDEVQRLLDNADLHRMNMPTMQASLTADEKKSLSWEEINQREPFSLLINEDGDPNPYPLDAFPPLARQAIQAIAYHAQAPEAMAGNCVLGSLAYLAQPHVNARSFQHQHGEPCSLFVLTEGASGDRKSTCHNLASLRLNEHESKAYNEYLDELETYKIELAGCKTPKEKEQYEAINPKPVNPKSMFADITVDSLVGAYIHDHLTNAYITGGEAGKLLGGHSLSSDNQALTASTYTELWDSGNASRHRSRSNVNGSGVAIDVRLSINMLGQRVILEKVLNSEVLMEQGFMARFLLTAPETMAGKRTHTAKTWHERPYTDKRLINYWARCVFLLDECRPSRSLEDGRLNRPVINLTPEADTLAMEFYNKTELEVKRSGKYAHLKPFADRALPNAVRIATVLAFFEGKKVITPELMTSGIKIAQHSLDEWQRYNIFIEHDESLKSADRVENWLISYCREHETTIVPRVKIQQGITPSGLRKKKKLEPLLKILMENNHIREVKHDGKASIELNPKVFTDK